MGDLPPIVCAEFSGVGWGVWGRLSPRGEELTNGMLYRSATDASGVLPALLTPPPPLLLLLLALCCSCRCRQLSSVSARCCCCSCDTPPLPPTACCCCCFPPCGCNGAAEGSDSRCGGVAAPCCCCCWASRNARSRLSGCCRWAGSAPPKLPAGVMGVTLPVGPLTGVLPVAAEGGGA